MFGSEGSAKQPDPSIVFTAVLVGPAGNGLGGRIDEGLTAIKEIDIAVSMSKRKGHTQAPSATKKTKVQHGSLNDLPWKPVARPVNTGLDGDDGILELEEVDNVEVVYEEKDGGKVVRFNVHSRPCILPITSNMSEPAAGLTGSRQHYGGRIVSRACW